MLVAAHAAALLCGCVLLGLPFTSLLASPTRSGGAPFDPAARLLLAPAVGLGVFAIYTAFFFAANRPLEDAARPFWVVLTAIWVVWLVSRLRRRGVRRPSKGLGLAGLGIAAGLCLVGAVYLWPFLVNPDFVFWHYAGTDGYEYIRMAEYLGSHGSRSVPQVGVYDAATSFTSVLLASFNLADVVERPATFAVLSVVSSLLGVTPLEAYSPLVVASVGALYLSLVAFAAHLGLPSPVRPLFGLAGALSPITWMLATETFLGNLLLLPLLPLLALLPELPLTPGVAAVAGIALAGLTVLYPDLTPAVVLISAPFACILLRRAQRAGTLRPLGAAAGVTLATGVACTLPLLVPLLRLGLSRIPYVVPATSTFAGSGLPLSGGGEAVHPLATWDWMWAAANVKGLPPEGLQGEDVPYLAIVLVLALVFLLAGAWRRRVTNLWCYAVSLTALIGVAGVTGLVRSDYVLFRIVAPFGFAFLGALFLAPSCVSRSSIRLGTWVAVLGVGLVLGRFAQVDYAQFELAYSQFMPEIEYTTRDLQDRAAVARLGQTHRVVFQGNTPTLTELTHVLVQFSSTQLGIPASFQKYYFFERTDRPPTPGDPTTLYRARTDPGSDDQYLADLVLRTRRNPDVWQPGPASRLVYTSPHVEVVENDLVPFFDNDALPVVNAFPSSVLDAHGMAVARTLSARTEIAFLSRLERMVQLEVSLDQADASAPIRVGLDANPARALVPEGGRVLQTLSVGRGLHKLVLEPTTGTPRVTRLRLDDAG